jgi:hypothetical protein
MNFPPFSTLRLRDRGALGTLALLAIIGLSRTAHAQNLGAD